MAIAAARARRARRLCHARRRRRIRTDVPSRCGNAKAWRSMALRSTPMRRRASTSSPTVRRATSSAICARARRRAGWRRRTCRCDVIRAGEVAPRVRHQPGDLGVGMRRGARGDGRRRAAQACAFPTTRTCGSSCGRCRARGRSSWRRLRVATTASRASTTRGCCSTPPTRRAIIDACHRAGAPIVVLKRGAEGCVVSDGARRERDRRASRRQRRCHRRRRLLRRRVRRAARRGRRPVRRRALRECRGSARHDRLRRRRSPAARRRRARAARARERDDGNDDRLGISRRPVRRRCRAGRRRNVRHRRRRSPTRFAALGAVVTVTGATRTEAEGARSAPDFRCRDAVAARRPRRCGDPCARRRSAAPRRARQLRGRDPPRRRARAGRVRRCHRHQPHRHDALLCDCAPEAAGATRQGGRRHRQHRVDAVVLGRRARAGLHREQGRRRATDARRSPLRTPRRASASTPWRRAG